MHLKSSDELSISGRMAEPAALMDLASVAKLRNILLYGIQLHPSKVSCVFPPSSLLFFLFLPEAGSESLCCESIFERGQTKQGGKCLVTVLFQCLVIPLCFRQGYCLLSHIFVLVCVHAWICIYLCANEK